MNKLFWLTSLAIICSCSIMAQQQETGDTAQLRLPKPAVEEDSSFIHFSCTVKDRNKVQLQWKADSAGEGDYFVVEHSNDGSSYETMGALKASGSTPAYELTDNAPFSGSNFYRIKYTGKSNQQRFSKTVQLVLSQSSAFKFYPNPVDKLLIIQTDHPVFIQIVSAQGTARISKQLQPGMQVVNVSALEKGNYLLRITDRESNRDMLEQLLKN